MIDYKNLTDDELLEIIDSQDDSYEEMRSAAQTDSEFRGRLINLKVKNKSEANDILETLEPRTEWVIDSLNKLLNTLPLNSPSRDKVIAKIDYYTEKFKNNG